MGYSIAVMNAKGGVGKSTVVMGLAETLSAVHKKSVLIIDSDSQTSISIMVMHMSRWEELERSKRTLVDYLAQRTLSGAAADWRAFVAQRVSDVEEAQSVYLLPSHMELSLFEREVSEKRLQSALAGTVRGLLDEAERYFDVVLVDCPPGISVLTETWLRECTFYLPPTKADYLSVRGLAIIDRYRSLMPEGGFAQCLGVLVNQKDGRIRAEDEWHQWLLREPRNACFATAIPRRAYIQRAADFDPGMRTYAAKYPGDAGEAMRAVADEMLQRLAIAPARTRPAPVPSPSLGSEATPASPPVEPATLVVSQTATQASTPLPGVEPVSTTGDLSDGSRSPIGREPPASPSPAPVGSRTGDAAPG